LKVRVFGRNSDDKGTQLESLTKRLLERRGYCQVTTNLLGPGGTEIDIAAEFPFPGLSGDNFVHVIGECKAYESPVAQPEWMKFLGKVYQTRVTRKREVRGIFLALSGVNGSFNGAYEDFRERDGSIELVTGDRLAEQMITEFRLPAITGFLYAIGRFTSDPITTISLGYYDSRAFWIAEFANETFTVLSGEKLDQKPSPEVIEMISQQLQAATYRDLFSEELAIQRRNFARKFVLGQSLAGLPITPPEQENFFPFNIVLSQSELDDALSQLRSEELIVEANGQPRLADMESNIERRVAVIREILKGPVVLTHLDTDQWDALIDEPLVRESLRIQRELPMPEECWPEILKLMKWSPSALFWSLNPDPLLTHPQENAAADAYLRPEHLRWYRAQMMALAVRDYQGHTFGKILFERHGLIELQFRKEAVFKTAKEPALTMDITERHRIAQAAADLGGGGLVQIWLTANHPEPWENQIVNSADS
jgi:hypothetical protein